MIILSNSLMKTRDSDQKLRLRQQIKDIRFFGALVIKMNLLLKLSTVNEILVNLQRKILQLTGLSLPMSRCVAYSAKPTCFMFGKGEIVLRVKRDVGMAYFGI